MKIEKVMDIAKSVFLNEGHRDNKNSYNPKRIKVINKIIEKINNGVKEFDVDGLKFDSEKLRLEALLFLSTEQVNLLEPCLYTKAGEEFSKSQYVKFVKTYEQGGKKKVKLKFKLVANPTVFNITGFESIEIAA